MRWNENCHEYDDCQHEPNKVVEEKFVLDPQVVGQTCTKNRLNFYTQSLRENPHNLFEVVVFFLDVLHFFGDGLGTYVVRNFEKTSWYTP